jgi:fibronectin type 3 domain-containing protein
MAPSEPLSYFVYEAPRDLRAAAKDAPPDPAAKGARRLTEKPGTALSWTDTASEVGVERCYDVRSVRVRESATIESVPSPVACITPADTFPPPAPSALVAVAGEGSVSLIWTGVDAPDLAGYIVLRGGAPDGAMAPLFDAPLPETTYKDTTAKPGVRYVYAIVAVDRAAPPNRSALSNKAEETAR